MDTKGKRSARQSCQDEDGRLGGPAAKKFRSQRRSSGARQNAAAANRGKTSKRLTFAEWQTNVVVGNRSPREFCRDERVDADAKKELASKMGGFLCSKEQSQGKNDRFTLGCRFLGEPFARAEAMRRWPHRYLSKSDAEGKLIANPLRKRKKSKDEAVETECTAHYSQAEVDHEIYGLGDCVHVNNDGGSDFLGRIVELYMLVDHTKWFRVQWFFRPEDTAVRSAGLLTDRMRVFFSDEVDDNLVECVVGKIRVIRTAVPLRLKISKQIIPRCDYYYDMGYDQAYSTFYELPEEAESSKKLSDLERGEESKSRKALQRSSARRGISCGVTSECSKALSLLDLYSGCGAMSTGLCMGARLTGTNLVTKWAVDLNEHACNSLKHNHPETQVRNEYAEDFLALIKEWEKLCQMYGNDPADYKSEANANGNDEDKGGGDEFEVEKILDIRWVGSSKLEPKLSKGKFSSCIRTSNKSPSEGLEFKVRWKGYNAADDTWEPAGNLINSQRRIKEFVMEGQSRGILPRPGACDVICGGPPCQGASGFNRYRNSSEPLQCSQNKQIIVYMDIVKYLKPRFVLMENVVDILKFADGILGRYALSRLVSMHYQARVGLLVAGCYGLPQFRMRVFIWGAAPGENLPPFPLPTHSVVMRGHAPQSWERNVVAFNESENPEVKKALVLNDAICDLPMITNSDEMDEMAYGKVPITEFQKLCRFPEHVHDRKLRPKQTNARPVLYDHRCLQLNADDFLRSSKIPKRKGSNFRDLGGIIVLPDGTVDVERKDRLLLPSGKPLVPDYALSFVGGKSLKPFGRLWWDETVSTVVTRAEPHNQCILHPSQDRVLSIRENARLQGFPDFYKLSGSVKERYIQVGNAVAIPVARALGYALAHSLKIYDSVDKKFQSNQALVQLPRNFPFCLLEGKISVVEGRH